LVFCGRESDVSAKDLQEQNLADFERVLNTDEGARYVAQLIDFCGTFVVNEEGSLFREGMRNVGLRKTPP
jgi:hypothetical protein